MKLRTTKNSIRIRIRKSELAKLAENGLIEESINFGNQVVFRFALSIDENSQAMSASLQKNYLLLALPEEAGLQWINTSQVGVEAFIEVSDTEKLHLLVEKDFPCLDREGEDKSDTFQELVPDQKPKVC